MTDNLDFSQEFYDMSEDDDYLAHVGILRKSGRYPWGSGETPNQRNKGFLDYVDELTKKGFTEVQIAEGMQLLDPDKNEVSTGAIRAAKAIAKNELKAAEIRTAEMLKEKGLSNVAIGAKMGINESSVRSLLDPATKEKNEKLVSTANMLKGQIEDKKYIDVGLGSEHHIGVSETQLKQAVAMLREEGYSYHYLKVDQLGTGKQTTMKVLAKPDVPWVEVRDNQGSIKSLNVSTDDKGMTWTDQVLPPRVISASRVGVKYGNQGGTDMDGVIQVRRGVDDVSLGNSKYAQVRIAVEGGRYLKGMAIYSDNLPDGVDLMFNTNKTDTGNKLDAMKKMNKLEDGSIDQKNPFGAVVKPHKEPITLADGTKQPRTVMNIVNEEGDWNRWSNNISSQALSKQRPALAKQQLDEKYRLKKAEFDEINALTNPAVKKKLLESFADDVDSSSVHLKAAALPRQRTQVILPMNSLKDGEIYAPNFRDGEKVVLIRYPHGGIFEIPELTVNNRNREGKSVLKGAMNIDAVGINAKVAERLSGADFDGDTVLVIPNNSGAIKNAPRLKGLVDFDPKTAYKPYDGMKTIDGGTWNDAERKVVYPPGKSGSGKQKQLKMGDVSNLITDMTIMGAPYVEIERAVKHSMVVIDAEKHSLNYKQSAIDNNIPELKKKYQKTERNDGRGGASTIISRASSDVRVDERKPRSAANGGPIDPVTGKKVYEYTGAGYTNKNGDYVKRKDSSKRMLETDDATTLMSGHGNTMEPIYAAHANRLKALANETRKAALSTPSVKYDPSAKKVYANEVASLKAKLNEANRNKPLERQAQLLANTMVTAKRQANPDMEKSDVKKIRGQSLTEARLRTGAQKSRIVPTPEEWIAIQSGAISNNFLNNILANADMDRIKELATPRERTVMIPARIARAKQMINSGLTPSEIADQLGVPISTLNDALKGLD